MIAHVTENRRSMFDDTVTHVRGGLDTMVKSVERKLEEATNRVFQTLQRDYQLLGKQDNNDGGDAPRYLSEKKDMRDVLGKVENDFREMLGLERLEELEGLEEIKEEEMEGEMMSEEEMRRVMVQLGQLPAEPVALAPEPEAPAPFPHGIDRAMDYLFPNGLPHLGYNYLLQGYNDDDEEPGMDLYGGDDGEEDEEDEEEWRGREDEDEGDSSDEELTEEDEEFMRGWFVPPL